MRVKTCGITRLQDAQLAFEAGVWAVGFIFVENTPRYITPENASEIIKKLPTNAEKVGVFADCDFDEAVNICKLTQITKIQLHGDETPEYSSEIFKITGKEVIKAFRVKNVEDIELMTKYKNTVSYILLDTYSATQKGGTGKTFDWNIAKQAKSLNMPLILAGGLNTDNLLSAYNEVMPFALDLSGGIEQSKGIKDPEKIKKLKEIINNTID